MAVAFTACDKIDEKDYFKPLAEEENTADLSTLLIEEYTGQYCVNCPSAAKLLHQQTKVFKDKVVIVNMHAPRTGMTRPELAAQEADIYAQNFKHALSVPGVMMNRKSINNSKYAQNSALWASNILKIVKEKPKYQLQLNKAEVNQSSQKISIEIEGNALNQSAEVKKTGIQVWIVEDVIAEQHTPAGTKDNYFHHNVFRGSLNGTWGEPYKLDDSYQIEAAIPENIKKIDNAKIVAFLFDMKSKEILDTQIMKLGEGIYPEDEDGDEEEKIPVIDSETLYFAIDGKVVKSGSEIHIKDAVLLDKTQNLIDMSSPFLYIMPGKKYGLGKYLLTVNQTNHIDDANSGLSMVCSDGKCEEAPEKSTFSKEISINSKKGNTAQSLSVHFFIKDKNSAKKNIYKVRVAFQKDGKEAAFLNFVFDYNPEKVK